MKIKLLITIFTSMVIFFNSSLSYALPQAQTKSSDITIKPPININTADLKTVTQSIKGIGLKRAEAIIKYREAHGPFNSIKDLEHVPGLGKKFVESHLEALNKRFTVG